MKRNYQPKQRKRNKKHGFFERKKRGGKTLASGRKKGRTQKTNKHH